MDGLASNLCILGIMYVISVIVYVFKRYMVDIEEREVRKNSKKGSWY